MMTPEQKATQNVRRLTKAGQDVLNGVSMSDRVAFFEALSTGGVGYSFSPRAVAGSFEVDLWEALGDRRLSLRGKSLRDIGQRMAKITREWSGT